ncbi:MAG: DEAD/DEAH box helicase [Bacilli bacterium]|jgi:ATP-dependent DNA helicase RecG|nr:DEAD/DEAH box helicase [Bacilli bacterium]
MRTSEIYEKLKAVKEEDILLHFPKRYDDLSLTNLSLPFQDKEKVVIVGRPLKMTSIQGGKIIRLTILSKDERQISGVFFGQPFYSHILKSLNTYFFFGVYKERQKAVMLSSALSITSPLVQNRYKPYYALPHEISQTNFYNLVLDILENRNDYIQEILPLRLREKYQLEDRLDAFVDVHVPSSEENIKRGLRVFKYEEALFYCLNSAYQKIQLSKVKKEGLTPIDKIKINQFILSLPYKLTSDQVQAVREIILDMDKEEVMSRLLEGDVGTGKTIVAFIALYANYLRGGQGVIMAPTLTLAEQHFIRAKEIFKNYPLRIVLLDNSLKPKEIKETEEMIKDGEADIIISTHFAFSEGVKYFNLSLAITDEQHKFGVAQREELVSKGHGVDSLMMSATPIPRTLSMIINSDLAVSILKQFPFKKRSVKTEIVSSSDPLIDKAIKRALQIHKQVFIVAPKIEKSEGSSRLSSQAVYEETKKAYGEENVALLTGRVKKADQQRIYDDFASGRKLILVATSLIEVGVDVKNAVLMIIYEANYFGLASLHQLRGRIGRSGEGAMALLVYDGEDEEATLKLNYLSNHDDGEEIALFDLEHRGGGDLSSQRQSGDSLLQVANFVSDYKVFECAKKDAEEILSDLANKDNSALLSLALQKEKEEKED